MKRLLFLLLFIPSITFAQTGKELDASGSGIQSNFFFEIAKGDVQGHSIVHKFGKNNAVANGAWELVSAASAATSFLSAATTVRVKAGDTADSTGNAGARAITVEGLDETGAAVTETIKTNGTSAGTASTTTFLRVFRAYVTADSAGTYGASNTAAVVIENSAGTADLLTIAIEEGQTQYGAYTIPLGKTGYLMSVTLQSDGVKAADFRLMTRADILDTSAPSEPVRIRLYFDGILGQESVQPLSPMLALTENTDIWVEANGSGAQTEVSVDFEIILVDN